MRQVLFVIPLHEYIGTLQPWLNFIPDVPVYGYGLMLMLAFIFCNLLAKRMCKKEGIDGSLMLDLTIWLFVSGLFGARLLYIIQYWNPQFASNPLSMLALWDGGLVFYGCLPTGAIGYFAYYHYCMRAHQVSNWKMLDVIAPCLALGLALGRIGCLFTGCCYGNVACESCPAIHFPLNSMPTWEMIRRGQQTPLGFLLREPSLQVVAVESGSSAEAAGLQKGDVIEEVNGIEVRESGQVWNATGVVNLTVKRNGANVTLPPFSPTSIGLNPTQIYETISMCLLLFFLLSYHPFKRHDGELLVFFLFGYGLHRFLNEMLRTDTDPVAFGLTLSQNISIGAWIGGAALAYVIWWWRPRHQPTPAPAAEATLPQPYVPADSTATGSAS